MLHVSIIHVAFVLLLLLPRLNRFIHPQSCHLTNLRHSFPNEQIRIAMDKQAAAERDRREQVLRAEGAKRKAELESEGVQISLKNESEGNLIKVRNEAEATKSKILLEAEAQAVAIEKIAKAQAIALKEIATELNKTGGEQAAQLALARDYVQMYGEMGKQSNTILFNDRPADVNALMVQAMTAMKVAGENVHTSKPPALPETTAEPPKSDDSMGEQK